MLPARDFAPAQWEGQHQRHRAHRLKWYWYRQHLRVLAKERRQQEKKIDSILPRLARRPQV